MIQSAERILALDPTTKGLGYVLFELPFRLLERQLAYISGDKNSRALAVFEKLLARFRPDRVVLEDAEAPGSRRSERVRKLLKAITRKAQDRGVEVAEIGRLAVLKCFSTRDGRATKYSIAERLAKDFPEAAERLPRRRKIWESESQSLAIFDALALAVAYAVQK